MQHKVLRAFSALALFSSFCACDSPEDVFHPRTAQNITRVSTRLPVTDSAAIVEFSDDFVEKSGRVQTQGSFTIVLRVNSLEMRPLLKLAEREDYKIIGSDAADSAVVNSLGVTSHLMSCRTLST